MVKIGASVKKVLNIALMEVFLKESAGRRSTALVSYE